MHDRQRCSYIRESVIPYLDYDKYFRDSWFVISFIYMSSKNAKSLQALLEGGGEKCRETYV